MKNYIAVDIEKAKEISPIKYGWHYEEIGRIGDSGLYAELIRNRDFAESGTADGLVVENGLYKDIPEPDKPQKRPEYLPELVGWRVLGENVTICRKTLSRKDRDYAMIIKVAKSQGEHYGVYNEGFARLKAKAGVRFKGVLQVACGDKSKFSVGISSLKGFVSNVAEIVVENDEKAGTVIVGFELTMIEDCDNGYFLITPEGLGVFELQFVSLFPCDTFNEGESVFRADIMKNLLDYEPDFLRFPGGCIVHGVSVETMYHWKETIGPIYERKSGWSKWQPHYMSNGIGYHEFLQLCEYLGCEAMYVAPTGMICTEWVFRKGNTDDYFHPNVNVDDYINDCLDAIEYALGDENTRWGSERVANGHKEPFNLKYVCVGNEDFGETYYRYYDKFYHAIRAKYPMLKIVASSIIGNRTREDWNDKRKRLTDFIDERTVEIFDEHYYDSGDWVFDNFELFDGYERNGPRLMCLELGLTSNQPSDILYEAVFLMMMEKNGDLEPMFAGRPLMRDWNYIEGKLNPYYYHDGEKCWKTIHYYAKKLFKDNPVDYLLPSRFFENDGEKRYGIDHLFSTVGINKREGKLIIKAVNLSDKEITAALSLEGSTSAELFTLKNTTELPKTMRESECVGVKCDHIQIDFSKPIAFTAKALTVLRCEMPKGLLNKIKMV